LLVVEKNDQVAGWTLLLCNEQSVIIDIMCVDPLFQKQGVGKALIGAIKEYFPEIRSIAVVTKKVNAVSPFFYERLGFVKTDFLYANHTSDEFQGYELVW
jgi:GNAT superfamily N-acetyltransferase